MNPLIFRAYDIRGIAFKPESNQPADLTPETIELIGKGAGTYLKRHFGARIAVGHDCRLSNPELSDAFIKGLRSTGCNVTLIGMTPTPLMFFTVCRFNFDGGAAITASHNPKEYNGVKLVGHMAHSIYGDDLQEVLKLIESNDFEEGEGTLEELDVFPAYLEKILSIVHLERPLKVVADAGNGASGPFVKPFFESLGCELIPLYCQPDGSFPNHPANPEEKANMLDLIKSVKENKADLGIGFDGDGDRVGIVDELGNHYSADLLLLLLAEDLLARLPNSKIIFDVKVSQVLIDGIKKAGGEPIMSKTGHSFIESKMKEIGAPLAGEISGHMFFAENYYGFDDAFLAAAKLLEILSKSNKTFSKLLADTPKTCSTPEIKTPCPDTEKFRIVDQITNAFTQKYDCITLDGVRVSFDDKSWGAVRCSNTSPNLTLRFEAPTEDRLKEIMHLMLTELKKHPELDLWWADKDLSEL
ncbi:phosphomannomutase/phosphoglucomutase [Patescibacteria group bacterium]|nr:phosphomannomutase/phosphoglucomutase [Patescibacteria group bacterium]